MVKFPLPLLPLLPLLALAALLAAAPARAAGPAPTPAVEPAAAQVPIIFDFTAAAAGGSATTPLPPLVRHDGKRVFLRELYTLKRAEDYRIAAFLGFNAVIEDGPATFELAAAHDFTVTEASWLGGLTLDDDRRDELAAYIHQPALLSLNLNDEPDLRPHWAGPEHITAISRQIHDAFPGVRTSVTLAGWGRDRDQTWPAYTAAVDIVRIDPYPLITRKPLRYVTDLTAAARAAAGPDKPIVVVLQGWTWQDQPLPTAAQLRNMVYQALIAGASGYSIFDWNLDTWARHPDFVRELQRLNHEVSLLMSDGRVAAPDGLMAYPTVEQDGIAVRLIRHGSAHPRIPPRWSLLAVDLNPLADSAREIVVRLPRSFASRLIAQYGIDGQSAVLRQGPGSEESVELRVRLDAAGTAWVTTWERVSYGALGHWAWPFGHDLLVREREAFPFAADLAGRPVRSLVWPAPRGRWAAPWPPPSRDTDATTSGIHRMFYWGSTTFVSESPIDTYPASWIIPADTLASCYGYAEHPYPEPNSMLRVAGGFYFRADSPYALPGPVNQVAMRHRIFPGGIHKLRIHTGFQPPPALADTDWADYVPTDPEPISLVSWHDNTQEITGEALAEIVSIERPTGTPAGVYDITVHLPPTTDWDRRRDHLLTVRIGDSHPVDSRYPLPGNQADAVYRVLRFRIENGYALDWTWTAGTNGKLLIRQTFPDSAYPPRDTRRVWCQADGFETRMTPGEGADTWDVTLQPLPGAVDTTRPVTLRAEIWQDGAPHASGSLASVHITDGRLARADSIKAITATHAEPIDLAGDFAERWAEAAQLPAAQHFLDSPRIFADVDHRLRFRWDDSALYAYIDIQGHPHGIRAEVTDDDSRWGGDDVAILVIQPRGGPDTYTVQVNPAGTTFHARIDAEPGRAWNPELRIRTHRQKTRWQAIVAIPWKSLGYPETPPIDSQIRLNIGVLQSIAPRVFTTWSDWSDPESEKFFGTLRLQ